MPAYIEPTFTPPADAGFDYGRGNVSFNSQVFVNPLTGVSFGMTRPGAGVLPDAIVWTIIFAGQVTSAPTVLLEGTLDGTNWFLLDTYNSSTSVMRSFSSHSASGLPTHILGIRSRISIGGTGTGNVTVVITA